MATILSKIQASTRYPRRLLTRRENPRRRVQWAHPSIGNMGPHIQQLAPTRCQAFHRLNYPTCAKSPLLCWSLSLRMRRTEEHPSAAVVQHLCSACQSFLLYPPCLCRAALTSADEHAQTSVSEHGDRHCPRPAGGRDGAEAARRVAQDGRATIRRIRLPEGAARKVSASVRRACIPGHLRGIGHEPGTWKDQEAQNKPACPAMAATRRLRAVPSQRPLAPWSQAHMLSCNRQVTSTSVHMAKPGSASAPRAHAAQ